MKAIKFSRVAAAMIMCTAAFTMSASAKTDSGSSPDQAVTSTNAPPAALHHANVFVARTANADNPRRQVYVVDRPAYDRTAIVALKRQRHIDTGVMDSDDGDASATADDFTPQPAVLFVIKGGDTGDPVGGSQILASTDGK